MLKENTDENHAMSANDIISALAKQGISAERKSIYDDIERLKLFGCDILSRRSEPKGYYLASRDFEIAELKLLVDAVQSSKFITEKKSNQLIHKMVCFYLYYNDLKEYQMFATLYFRYS